MIWRQFIALVPALALSAVGFAGEVADELLESLLAWAEGSK